jgi:hypothetical protein
VDRILSVPERLAILGHTRFDWEIACVIKHSGVNYRKHKLIFCAPVLQYPFESFQPFNNLTIKILVIEILNVRRVFTAFCMDVPGHWREQHNTSIPQCLGKG